MSDYALGLFAVMTVIVAVSLFSGSRYKQNKRKEDPDIWPFYKCRLMTTPEQKLYWRLLKACPDRIVLAQVQASRVIRVKKSYNFQYWFNRINRTSYDFVVCDKSSFPLAVIELDDSSHHSEKRKLDDERKNKALAGANLVIYRWHVSQIPAEDEIKKLFSDR